MDETMTGAVKSGPEAKKLLKERMQSICKCCWGEEWIPGVEYALWSAILSPLGKEYYCLGFGYIFPEELRDLAKIVQAAQCWYTSGGFMEIGTWREVFLSAKRTEWRGVSSQILFTEARPC